MCEACWKDDYEAAAIDSPEVRAAALAIAEVYEFSDVGGNLHVQLDDWNIDDQFWDSPDQHLERNIHEAEPDQLETERRCWWLMAALPEAERASALALQEGFWRPENAQTCPICEGRRCGNCHNLGWLLRVGEARR